MCQIITGVSVSYTKSSTQYTCQAQGNDKYISFVLTVGGERLTVDPRRSWGPMLECLLMGSPPPPGVPPGEDAHDGAMRIFGGIISALSERRLLGKALWTLRKLLSGEDGEAPNHHPPRTPESVAFGAPELRQQEWNK
jgi:hypothetical protein